ncbi:MAG: AraC family transcriptional regulator [Lachnospiraceae bacterium]|nr:AraC family transcriptional regulator [Lachnospiraceae bacterium]
MAYKTTVPVVQTLHAAPQNTFVDQQINSRFRDLIISSDISTANGTSRQGEQYLMALVENGNVTELDQLLSLADGQSLTIGYMSEDPLRQAKYTFVCMITLTTRAAIAGGMPESDAYDRSDAYIQQADKMSDIDEIFRLMASALKDFTKRVRNARRTAYTSLPVIKAVKYIENNLRSPLSLRALAEHCKVTAPYLSAAFHRETGMTVTAYIRRQRLEVAAVLLRTGEFSVGTVSDLLCFPSPSAFIKAFRQIYGMTPASYQKKI